jgi:transcriptional activator HAC1
MSTVVDASTKPIISVHNLKMEAIENSPSFVKMNDVENSQPSVSSFSLDGAASAGSPGLAMEAPRPTESKPVKKRKTWGQKLPEPTTNLPPRKRAKTEAEKEQRRIERVKRNRQAAHNSRERKRIEHENLLDEKNAFQAECYKLSQVLEALKSQIRGLGQEPNIPDVVVPVFKTEMSEYSDLSEIKLESSSSSIGASPSTTSSVHNTPSLSNTASPSEGSLPYTPSVHAHDIELTQQSAVLLCSSDLQCRSTSSALVTASLLLQLLWRWTQTISALSSTLTSTAMTLHSSSLLPLLPPPAASTSHSAPPTARIPLLSTLRPL